MVNHNKRHGLGSGPGAHSYHPRGGTSPKPAKGAPDKIHRAMHEFKHGELHSGSKKGPVVKSRKQAIAIALSEQKKANKGGYK